MLRSGDKILIKNLWEFKNISAPSLTGPKEISQRELEKTNFTPLRKLRTIT